MDPQDAPVLDEATTAPFLHRLYGWEGDAVPRTVARIDEQTLGLSGGLFRVTGGIDNESSWSIILKVLRPVEPAFLARFPATDHERLRDLYLWDREARFYESGLAEALTGGFSAARCVAVRQNSDRYWLLCEDLGDNSGRWDVQRYALAARQLGHFNGAFAPMRSGPENAWLCRDWLRTWLFHGPSSLQHDILVNEAIWRHALVRHAFPPGTNVRLQRVWERRGGLLDRLDALPPTLCHMDAFRPNLFDRMTDEGTHRTVAVDWSYVGIDPIGADLAQLVTASTLSFADPAQEIGALAAAALPEYVDGLRDAGWHGMESDVRTGFALGTIRHLFMLRSLRGVLEPREQLRLSTWAGRPYRDIIVSAARRTTYLLDLIDKALR